MTMQNVLLSFIVGVLATRCMFVYGCCSRRMAGAESAVRVLDAHLTGRLYTIEKSKIAYLWQLSCIGQSTRPWGPFCAMERLTQPPCICDFPAVLFAWMFCNVRHSRPVAAWGEAHPPSTFRPKNALTPSVHFNFCGIFLQAARKCKSAKCAAQNLNRDES